MKAILIVEAFHAYENGKRVYYVAGQKPSMPDDLAKLYVRKGHAKPIPPEKPSIEGESE